MDLQKTVSGKGGGLRMKRGWKIFWIICASAAVIGIGCCVAAIGLGVTTEVIRGHFPNGIALMRSHNNRPGEEYTRDSDASEVLAGGQDSRKITGIDAEISAGNFQILKSDTEEIRLETRNVDSRLGLNYCVEDGELVIETKKNLARLIGTNNYSYGTVYLFVPEDYTVEYANLEIGAGELYVEYIGANKLDIQVGIGKAEVKDFRAVNVDMDCGAGTIQAASAADPLVSEYNINCGIGEIQLKAGSKKEEYDYSIKCGIGQVRLGGEQYSGLGGRKEIDNGAGRKMDMDCGIGEVTVSFEDSF